MIRKASAVWRRSGRAGSAGFSSDSRVLEQDKERSRISPSALTLRASAPDLDQDTFAPLTRDTEQHRPASGVLQAEITLDASPV